VNKARNFTLAKRKKTIIMAGRDFFNKREDRSLENPHRNGEFSLRAVLDFLEGNGLLFDCSFDFRRSLRRRKRNRPKKEKKLFTSRILQGLLKEVPTLSPQEGETSSLLFFAEQKRKRGRTLSPPPTMGFPGI